MWVDNLEMSLEYFIEIEDYEKCQEVQQLIDKIKADFYITEKGERIHPVTMWHRHKTRKFSFLKKQYPNIKKANGYQLKFIYYIR